MERVYADGVKTDVEFFTGMEVENTPQKRAFTLFVVGLHSVDTIHELAQQNVCRHVYLGANQSFAASGYNDAEVWQQWDDVACGLLAKNYWVTLDFDISHWQGVLEMRANEHAQFIPQVSVKLPYTRLANYNTCIKLDDTGFNATNPGVWVHSLHKLMDREAFTSWDAYQGDAQL
jgi:hypothetical protein